MSRTRDSVRVKTDHVREDYYSARVEDLRKAFKAIDVDGDKRLSKIELFKFLDDRSRKEFDRGVASELFEQMDSDKDELITFNEFARGYIQAEERLHHKLAHYNDRNKELDNEIVTFNSKLDQAKKTEKKNSFGIMTDSNVILSLRKVKYFEGGLFRKNTNSFYLKVAHGNSLFKTKEFKNEQEIDDQFKMYSII